MSILNPEIRLHRILGRWRLLFGSCPRCNSDAPEVYHCAVCKQVHVDGQSLTVKNQRYLPNRATKALWWYTWMHPGFNELQNKWEKYIGE